MKAAHTKLGSIMCEPATAIETWSGWKTVCMWSWPALRDGGGGCTIAAQCDGEATQPLVQERLQPCSPGWTTEPGEVHTS